MNAGIAPVRPFTQRLLDRVRLFDGCRGGIDVDMRSLDGIGHSVLYLTPPTGAIPLPLLDAIRDAWGARVMPVTRAAGHPQDLASAFVYWRAETRFDRDTEWRYVVAPEAQARIREALGAFPMPPAQLVDAGPEIVALWPLDSPLAVDRDPTRAIALLVALAERLGADVEIARDLAATLPLAGVIRGDWNHTDLVDIVDVEPARRYRVEDLEAALATPQLAAEGTPRRKKGVPA